MVLDARVAFMRRASGALLSATAFMWMACFLSNNPEHTAAASSLISLRSLTEMIPVQPVIYTFAEDEDRSNNDHLDLWKTAWQSAGFDARILREQDAHQHSDYEAYNEAMAQVIPYGHHDEKKTCLKYLAMNAVGGGYLADSTVLPLWPSSSNRPRDFTVQCGSMHKPAACFMSGSAEEWNRVAMALLASLQRHYDARRDYQTQQQQQGTTGTGTTAMELVPAYPSIPQWVEQYALQELCSLAHGKPIITRVESSTLSWRQAQDVAASSSAIVCHDHLHRMAVQWNDNDASSRSSILEWLQRWNKECVQKLHHKNLALPKA